jgi:hypothetical protein
MNIYNSPVTKIAFWVIVIGGAACLLIPLFAPLLPLQYLKGYGEIGDALGGISSPFVQIWVRLHKGTKPTIGFCHTVAVASL